MSRWERGEETKKRIFPGGDGNVRKCVGSQGGDSCAFPGRTLEKVGSPEQVVPSLAENAGGGAEGVPRAWTGVS